ncbi:MULTISPECIES: S46 family peptidase [unclassified Wenzhouxiangella]|uniref:S46 family peptidase n=1 Tax=unclassified Wenzhouxiangella TaxID=2613841 RepID=UPI000E3281EB|nr:MULTISPECIES: S46 family peptidase [unclassified Wenzhouxiangella]RFF26703.1 S46 family peptidase [Wenzhouxiangella sp. 15181]RFP69328.1 S46 family peptidase [Wenzhouxiangella sp. 15190]
MKYTTIALAAAYALAGTATAKEGMWTPDQLPLIAEDLRETGLELDPDSLDELTAFPMGAVASLGGCTASFVSPEGLVITNHHCARGSIQFNSTEEKNYLEAGFLAEDPADELPAAPGTRVYVTVAVENVTDRMREGISADMEGQAVHDSIDARRKEIIAECEQQPGHRCQVASFHGGLEYKLIDRLEIRDVRLAYAPADNIGRYGGDEDNWMWPRHTGDFAFYRAYVGPDGQPAEHSADNVPFEPEHHLKVSAAGLDDGDFVMAAGYPGSTRRYARMHEVINTFQWRYPKTIDMLENWIATIEQAAPEGSDARIKYESMLAGLNNYHKNLGGQIEGARRVDLVERRREREEALDAWIESQAPDQGYAETLEKLDALSEESAQSAREDWYYDNATRSSLLSAAQRLYRLANERRKPDAERESGYQERDMSFFKQGMQAIERRFDPAVDKAVWLHFLKQYMNAPETARVAELDEALDLPETWDEDEVARTLDRFYEETELDDVERRLALMEADLADLDDSTDPFIQLAAALYDHRMAQEAESEDRVGRMQILRPDYMEAIINWQEDQGYAAYPDANSTLRITYGTVMGGSPRDGLVYEPFTTLEGILEKNTGKAPFNAPERQLELIRQGDYGPYELESIDSVPVNFLSDLDSTGGNSGSATLNARGELVGLLFDGTIESVNSDWDFDPRTTRTIHVDTRYMLWVMDKVDGAGALIEEMDLVE